jgi:predicted Zn finger-like uncharacterized protein
LHLPWTGNATVDQSAIAVRLLVEIPNGGQAQMREVATEVGQVFLVQHLCLSLIGTPGHAGEFYLFRLVFAKASLLFLLPNWNSSPMQKNKINLAKVLAALNSVCPSCGASIPPAEVVRIDSERMRCPKCGHVFEARK